MKDNALKDAKHSKTRVVYACKVAQGVKTEDEADLYFAPTFIINPPLDSDIMQNEIFGPIIPVVVHDFGSVDYSGGGARSDSEDKLLKRFNQKKLKEARVNACVDLINSVCESPLGLYVFGNDFQSVSSYVDSIVLRHDSSSTSTSNHDQ